MIGRVKGEAVPVYRGVEQDMEQGRAEWAKSKVEGLRACGKRRKVIRWME
jgi:hypothetical protein